MGENSNMIVMIAIIVVVVGGLIAFYVIRGMKGNLTLTLNHRGLSSGDKFTGTVQVVCNRLFSLEQGARCLLMEQGRALTPISGQVSLRRPMNLRMMIPCNGQAVPLPR